MIPQEYLIPAGVTKANWDGALALEVTGIEELEHPSKTHSMLPNPLTLPPLDETYRPIKMRL